MRIDELIDGLIDPERRRRDRGTGRRRGVGASKKTRKTKTTATAVDGRCRSASLLKLKEDGLARLGEIKAPLHGKAVPLQKKGSQDKDLPQAAAERSPKR
jgi:RNA polymerase primary sigma factor